MSSAKPQVSHPVRVVIAGGGTAGHVYPGLAVAGALVKRGYEPRAIHFVGSSRGVEKDLVPKAGFELSVLAGRGIQRQMSLQNAKSVWGLAKAVPQAIDLLRRLEPGVVLGVGGYASVPCVLAAKRLGIPLVIAEQNAVAGLANRLAGRWSQAAAVAFPDTGLPKAVRTGNPVRDEIQAVDPHAHRMRARTALGVDPERLLVVVVSGSLGAARINSATFEAVRAWRDRADLSVYHVVGKRDWHQLAALRRAAQAVTQAETQADTQAHIQASTQADKSDLGLQYLATEYCEQMADVYAAADLIVGRAGASSLAELTAVGVASLLVPLAGAPGDHQMANATYLAAQGAAVLTLDEELDANKLIVEVERLLSNPTGLEAMAKRAKSLGCLDADERVADLLEKHASGPMPLHSGTQG